MKPNSERITLALSILLIAGIVAFILKFLS